MEIQCYKCDFVQFADMWNACPQARAYIPGKALLSVLQLLHTYTNINAHIHTYICEHVRT